MHHTLQFYRRLVAIGLLAVGALGNSGCVPGVAWLPDSSGFVYTSGKQFTRLMLYDVGKRQPQVLVADTGAGTLRPALSPDGQRIAVGKLILTPGQKEVRLQVILYSRGGKEISRSKQFDWAQLKQPATAQGKLDSGHFPQLFWAPRTDQILVHTSAGDLAGYTAIYDVKADRLLHQAEGQLFTFGGNAVRPDGAGFLLMKNVRWPNWWDKKAGEVDPDPHFAFITWEGKEQPLKPPALLLDRAALQQEKDANKLSALVWPAYYDSDWHGDVAQVAWNVDRMRYLTSKGEAVLDRVKPEKTKDGGLIMRQYQFPGGQARLRQVVTKWDERNPEKAGPAHLEIVKPGQEHPQILVADVVPCVLIPAPNRKLLAVWAREKNQQELGLILVVSDQGEVVARLTID
jgi:hypothetical protein